MRLAFDALVMAYEVHIVGSLALPKGKLAAFRGRSLDESRFGDWPESLAPTAETASEIEGVLVGRWLDDCERFRPAGERSFLDLVLSVDDDRLDAVGLLPDTEFEEWKRPLATLFRVGALEGGTGELAFWRLSSTGLDFGYRVVAEGGASRVERMESVASLPPFPQHRRERGSRHEAFDTDTTGSGVFPTDPLSNDTKGLDP